jgi:hypothetical protein
MADFSNGSARLTILASPSIRTAKTLRSRIIANSLTE